MHRTRKIYLSAGATVQGGGAGGFDPLSLSPTAWWDPSDLTTLFQDSAGTTPVTSDGDVVGLMQDKSGNGYDLIQGTTANKPLYKTAAGLHWLECDIVDDSMASSAYSLSLPHYIMAAFSRADNGPSTLFGIGSSTNGHRFLNIGTNLRMSGSIRLNAGATNSAVSAANAWLADAVHVGETQVLAGTSISMVTDGGTPVTAATAYSAETDATQGAFLRSNSSSIRRFYGGFMKLADMSGNTAELLTWMGAKAGLTL